MSPDQFFSDGFKALTGNTPFKWQKRLFSNHFVSVPSDIPSRIAIPTGLGKTSVIVVWLLALAYQAPKNQVLLPRQLIYVVNRRTVVDQATTVAEKLRNALQNTEDNRLKGVCSDLHKHLSSLCANKFDNESPPLAISTLRGELADNKEWQTDPSRPSIIIGTVDMIGSRLLFSGYGVSQKMRPFHAGLLGQNALIIHDEAHLTPAFGQLVNSIIEKQKKHECGLFPLQLLELSATLRAETADEPNSDFRLDGDEEEKEIKKRILAPKTLILIPDEVDNRGEDIAKKLSELALKSAENKVRVLVYVNKPKIAVKVAQAIAKEVGKDRVKTLTGTLRGYERDILAQTDLFRGFQAQPNRAPPEESEYLISTSAGEVGVDLDADEMVCEITTLDSIVQRLGRVNRLGESDQAEISLVYVKPKKKQKESDFTNRITRTWELLQSKLPDSSDGKGRDASSDALQVLLSENEEACKEAFSEGPAIEPLTDILLDNWSMTRATALPGRPPVAAWLHGIQGYYPSLYVAWRKEIEHFSEGSSKYLKELFDKHPILSRERLRGNDQDVIDELKKIHKRNQDVNIVLIPATGNPKYISLGSILQNKNIRKFSEGTIVLPTNAGGLSDDGLLDGGKKNLVSDKADSYGDMAKPLQTSERLRVLIKQGDDVEEWRMQLFCSAGPEEVIKTDDAHEAIKTVRKKILMDEEFPMAEKSCLILREDEEGNPTKILMLFSEVKSVDIVQESPAAARGSQELEEHLDWTRREAQVIVEKLKIDFASEDSKNIEDAIMVAAHWHDRGKNRVAWQEAIGHPPPTNGAQSAANDWRPWAKSGKRGFNVNKCKGYRHEFGSLREAAEDEKIKQHPERELILHLIASHHGWSRPYFKATQLDIEDVSVDQNNMVSFEAMQRFAKLQRRFGHWGLAWLEALLRSADYAASRRVEKN